MKKYFNPYISALLVGLASFTSCKKNFTDLNTNPNAVTTSTPAYMFTKAEYDGTANMLNLLLGTMQYTTSYNDVAGFGSKYIASQVNTTSASFSSAYPNEINELKEVIKVVKTDPTQVNLYAEARIWRVYCFSRLTDLYGDIPYSQAAEGYTDGIFTPSYDAQKDIYADMLNELDQAAQSLDASKTTFGAADLIYGGNVSQWKKFAYSLMLRLGMRLTKVDATSAQTWVTKAISGGVILQDADVAKMSYKGAGQDINKNPLALNLYNSDYIAANGNTNQEGGKYQDVFINYLKQTKDPRLGVVSIVYTSAGVTDTTFAKQQGMPATLSSKPANFSSLSEPNPATVLLMSSPRLVFTAAESYFLLAEAALRGWYTGATAQQCYNNGTSAAMRQWAIIGGTAGTISTNQINTYLKYNGLNTAGSVDAQMNQIYTQFWVSIFPDAQEVFASYRRTGYPALTPNNYPGNITGGVIFRRMLYPLSEQNLNAKSYAAAISRQGADNVLTRIWWDK
ncbi:SusD/RagB family nutrient-binding outer membrane lipoprotein [Mucilaginibacter sp. KACC 22063]|uniref:SusD/RagB family nutrient-binding outer membrane lipoprotein n=1 Tax=Mucilaginibacter sp. KACC 22063 TaxID=3025666 RepID=UPI00236620BC|nr:SusD/RagB family nutrient-binding outer membrane lipoprotein [Mucilaginibacter sp. KACC 22063]WDF54184.1 SusD/RagB family nutrient-binding outer membrane lipoprotein [Mucilaginibacter sp. KACC 22063]